MTIWPVVLENRENYYRVLQLTARCYNAPRRTTTHYNVRQRTTTCHNVLQRRIKKFVKSTLGKVLLWTAPIQVIHTKRNLVQPVQIPAQRRKYENYRLELRWFHVGNKFFRTGLFPPQWLYLNWCNITCKIFAHLYIIFMLANAIGTTPIWWPNVFPTRHWSGWCLVCFYGN